MRGHLVIADISGYTQFLTEGELEHAHGIITDLMNAVVEAVHAPLAISSIQGDAVLMYGDSEGFFGQTVLETVEAIYVSFASALESMVLNTTCNCNACANINTLGLKIVMHCGEFIKSDVGGTESLSGPDVILVHRLLKNTIREKTGIADYLLITKACVEALELQRVVGAWPEHSEEYEHVGRVDGHVSSLSDAWEFARSQRSNKVLGPEAWISFQGHTQATPAVVWDYFIDPRKRNDWMGSDSTDVSTADSGRIAEGAEYHCVHGDTVATFAVLDSRPLEYITLRAPFPGGWGFRYTHYAIPSGNGTRIVTFIDQPTSTDPATDLPMSLEEARPFVEETVGGGLERLYASLDGVG